MKNPKHIVITGASSGLGAALAEAYASPDIVLGLLGRDEERLTEVRWRCESKGAAVQTGVMDVTDAKAMAEWLTVFDALHPIDLVIANAGISGGSGGGVEGEAQTRKIFDVNVNGVLNTVLPVVPQMVGRGKGQIAVMSSLAGMRGLPSAPAYSASKAAVKAFGEALRGELGKKGVQVSVICPGYIKTPLTDVNTFPMPFIMSAERAAERIQKGLVRNKPRIAFPLRLYLPLWFASCLSPHLTDRFFAALPSKGNTP